MKSSSNVAVSVVEVVECLGTELEVARCKIYVREVREVKVTAKNGGPQPSPLLFPSFTPLAYLLEDRHSEGKRIP